MNEPAGEWPPPGTNLPIYDEEDLHIVGWEGGTVTEGEYAGCTVLQTGPCDSHSAIVFQPGGHIICTAEGRLVMNNVNFIGHGPLNHDPDCSSQRPNGL